MIIKRLAVGRFCCCRPRPTLHVHALTMSAADNEVATKATESSKSKLRIVTGQDKITMGFAAASCGAEFIRRAIRDRGEANIIVATGASQFEVLASLVEATGIQWSKCNFFHLDEYIGITPSHGLLCCARTRGLFDDADFRFGCNCSLLCHRSIFCKVFERAARGQASRRARII